MKKATCEKNTKPPKNKRLQFARIFSCTYLTYTTKSSCYKLKTILMKLISNYCKQQINSVWGPGGVMTKVLDWSLEVTKYELMSRWYVHFQTNWFKNSCDKTTQEKWFVHFQTPNYSHMRISP